MAAFDPSKYDDVDSRIEKFYTAHPSPEGRIITEMLSDPNRLDECVVRAAIYIGDVLCATGIAFEKRGGSMANKDFHVENAETSAIGRAFANMGYKTTKEAPRPTRQEMQKPTRQQPAVHQDQSPATGDPKQDWQALLTAWSAAGLYEAAGNQPPAAKHVAKLAELFGVAATDSAGVAAGLNKLGYLLSQTPYQHWGGLEQLCSERLQLTGVKTIMHIKPADFPRLEQYLLHGTTTDQHAAPA